MRFMRRLHLKTTFHPIQSRKWGGGGGGGGEVGALRLWFKIVLGEILDDVCHTNAGKSKT